MSSMATAGVGPAPAEWVTTRRRLLAAATGVSAGAGAAACAPGGGAQPAGGAGSAARPSATLQVVYPPTSEADREIFARIFKRFEEEYQGLTVQYDDAAIGHGDRLAEKLTTAVAGGTPPDISIIHPSWSISLLSKGFFLELSDRMKQDRALRPDDLLPYALEFYQWQGKQFGLPYYSGPGLFYFNKTLFDQYGVKTPDRYEREGRWTWETFLEVARQLTRRDLSPPIFGYERVDGGLQWYVSVPVWAYGGEITTRDDGESRLHEPGAVEALELQADMVRAHRVVPIGDEVRTVPDPGSRRLNSGRVGMQFGGKFYVPDFKGHATFELGVAPVPKGPKGRATRDGNNGFGILKDSKNHDASYTLAAYFTQWEGGGRLLMESGRPQPVRKSVYADGSFKKMLEPWEVPYHEFYVETANIVRVWRIPRAGPQVQTLFSEQWNAILEGQRSVKAAMDELRPRLNELLRQAA
ncbi:MAG TPA: sugar ABC transporter substrate-binding protein [Chloroflexota bacterium]|nr:sugar ABC transporter substrate-binding protein [Chloroflexota bacterium]